MFNLAVQNVFHTHQQFMQVTDDFEAQNKRKLKQCLTCVNHNDVFGHFQVLVEELKEVEIWSPRLCWLSGCYTSSQYNILQYHKYKQPSELNYVDIRSLLNNIYNILSSKQYLLLSDNISKLISLMSCTEIYQKEIKPLVTFISQVLKTLNVIIDHSILTCIKIQEIDLSSCQDCVVRECTDISISYLLIDAMMTLIHSIPNLPASVEMFIIAPYIELVVFAGYVSNDLISSVLVVTPTDISILENHFVSTLFGLVATHRSIKGFNMYIDYIQQYSSDFPLLERYREILQRLQNCPGFLQGRPHKLLYGGLTVNQLLSPIHYSTAAVDIDVSDLIIGLLSSCFVNNDIPGIIDDKTGKILLEYECTGKETTWYDICAYHFAPYMKILGSDIYEFKYIPNSVSLDVQKSFILTAAYFFVDDLDIINVYWSNSYYWKVIPFSIQLFFPPTMTNYNESVYKLLVPSAIIGNTPAELLVNKEFKMVSETEHREVNKGVYTSLLFSRVYASIRSFVLLTNLDNKYAIFNLFPLLDTEYICLLPLSLKYKDQDNIFILMANLLELHGQTGKTLVSEKFQALFPMKYAQSI